MGQPGVQGRVGSTQRDEHQVVPISTKFWAVMSPFYGQYNKHRARSVALLVCCVVLLMTESAVLVAFSYTQVIRCQHPHLGCHRR